MPQDIPLEASETLVFTPASLKGLSPAPTFTLRTPTSREKRFRQRIQRENGVFTHTREAFRDVLIEGLKALWTPEQFDQFSGWITDYWDATDAFDKLREEDPEAVFVYDPDIEREVLALQSKLEKSYRPLAQMVADTAEFRQMQPLFYIAVTVIEWTGLKTKLELDRGYLTIDCVDAIGDELLELDGKVGSAPGTAMNQLFLELIRRTHLDEDEGKNSASPSPSKTTEPASTATSTSETDGSSPASKTPSTKTRETE